MDWCHDDGTRAPHYTISFLSMLTELGTKSRAIISSAFVCFVDFPQKFSVSDAVLFNCGVSSSLLQFRRRRRDDDNLFIRCCVGVVCAYSRCRVSSSRFSRA